MPAMTSIALFSMAASTLGASVYQAERGAQMQRKGIRQQEDAQRQSLKLAFQQQRKSEEAVRASTSKKTPDIAQILAGAKSNKSPTSMLTGPTGISDSALTLGKNTLLGQ